MSKEYLFTEDEMEKLRTLVWGIEGQGSLAYDMLEEKQPIEPPTSEEVCKAYFKETNWHLQYYKETNCFMEQGFIVAIKTDNGIGIIKTLSPHLITMIGKFYEKEVNK